MRLPGSVGNLGDSLLHVLIGGLLLVIAVPITIGAIQFLVREARRESRK
jgi:uncharacterized membrane protein